MTPQKTALSFTLVKMGTMMLKARSPDGSRTGPSTIALAFLRARSSVAT